MFEEFCQWCAPPYAWVNDDGSCTCLGYCTGCPIVCEDPTSPDWYAQPGSALVDWAPAAIPNSLCGPGCSPDAPPAEPAPAPDPDPSPPPPPACVPGAAVTNESACASCVYVCPITEGIADCQRICTGCETCDPPGSVTTSVISVPNEECSDWLGVPCEDQPEEPEEPAPEPPADQAACEAAAASFNPTCTVTIPALGGLPCTHMSQPPCPCTLPGGDTDGEGFDPALCGCCWCNMECAGLNWSWDEAAGQCVQVPTTPFTMFQPLLNNTLIIGGESTPIQQCEAIQAGVVTLLNPPPSP